MTLNESFSLVLALLAALTAGLVGAFALMKRMTLAGDAMSHIALPGLGLAILLGVNPILGGALALLVGSLLVWDLERRTGLATETMIGVIFSAALAVGALITPNEDLIEALFGGFEAVSLNVFLAYLAIALVTLFLLYRFRHQLVLGLFSSDLARASGVKLDRVNLYFLLCFSLSLILGLRFLGALLVGSLIIIPAALARQVTQRFSDFLTVSAMVSLFSVAIGFSISEYYHLALGPVVVTTAAVLFAMSLLQTRR